MAALLKDAIHPNLVQTLEGTPGARPRRPVRQHRARLQLDPRDADRDALRRDRGHGGGFRLRSRRREVPRHQVRLRATCWPSVVVLVATVRALKMHGGAPKDALGVEDLAALSRGVLNLERHLDNVRIFGLPAVVAINRFPTDSPAEIAFLEKRCAELGREGRALGGLRPRRRRRRGSRPRRPRRRSPAAPARYRPLYPWDRPARREDRDHRAPPLRRRGRLLLEGGRAAARSATRNRASATCRSTSPRRRTPFRTIRRRAAARPDSRSTWTRRASSPGAGFVVADLRRHHDDARPAEEARGRDDRRRLRRARLRPLLIREPPRRREVTEGRSVPARQILPPRTMKCIRCELVKEACRSC